VLDLVEAASEGLLQQICDPVEASNADPAR
jgi:hypothetical protein